MGWQQKIAIIRREDLLWLDQRISDDYPVGKTSEEGTAMTEDNSLVGQAAKLRNEAEAERLASKERSEKWHRIRLRTYGAAKLTPVLVAAVLLIFLIVDKLWGQ